MRSVSASGLLGLLLLGPSAWAQSPESAPPTAPAALPAPYAPPPGAPAPSAPDPSDPATIPPQVEAAPIPAAGAAGGFCYAGPHPVDTRVAAGPAWDDARGQHIHFYAPFDLRLFAYRDGCYHFIGDPSDFGYRGQTFTYYGAHPVLDGYGGGWCFAIGAHAHPWEPWDVRFRVVGGRFFWTGPYDRHFWAYWPYWAHYYERLYPTYYRGGRFHARPGWAPREARGLGWDASGRPQGGDPVHPNYRPGDRVAPPIMRVPQPPVLDETWRARPDGPPDRSGAGRASTGTWGAPRNRVRRRGAD